MRINLLTDAPRHNLALMKISTYHKARGDTVTLNQPMKPCDLSYGSWLFQRLYHTDITGGPAYDPLERLPAEIGAAAPNYELYPELDYSLGITWEWCPFKCSFCAVPKQIPPRAHSSIRQFHNPEFGKICLLNNNTFSDPQWRETFEEVWEAGLEMIDQNGYDLRLLDEEKAEALKRTKFAGRLYFAFDRIEDEPAIKHGLEILRRIKIGHRIGVFVLIGYPPGRGIDEIDIHRCQVIADYGFDPFIMIYNNSNNPQLRWFRWMTHRAFTWRKMGFRKAWEEGYRTIKRKRKTLVTKHS